MTIFMHAIIPIVSEPRNLSHNIALDGHILEILYAGLKYEYGLPMEIHADLRTCQRTGEVRQRLLFTDVWLSFAFAPGDSDIAPLASL